MWTSFNLSLKSLLTNVFPDFTFPITNIDGLITTSVGTDGEFNNFGLSETNYLYSSSTR